MAVVRLSTLSDDPRIFFESFENDKSPIIQRNELTFLARIFFFPTAGCLDNCYLGLPLDTQDGQYWTSGLELPPHLPEIDTFLYGKLRQEYSKLVESGDHLVNATMVVDTTEVRNLAIPVQGRLVWPSLLKQSKIQFPLTALGNYTVC